MIYSGISFYVPNLKEKLPEIPEVCREIKNCIGKFHGQVPLTDKIRIFCMIS